MENGFRLGITVWPGIHELVRIFSLVLVPCAVQDSAIHRARTVKTRTNLHRVVRGFLVSA